MSTNQTFVLKADHFVRHPDGGKVWHQAPDQRFDNLMDAASNAMAVFTNPSAMVVEVEVYEDGAPVARPVYLSRLSL